MVALWTRNERAAIGRLDGSTAISLLDDLACNTMICDVTDFRITYASRATIETLSRIEHVLPVKAKDLVGASIDVFHKNPAHQRKLLANPSNLP